MSVARYTLRRARPADVGALEELIAEAARALSREAYEPRQLERCESEAAAAGFARLELVATLPGTPFYLARGYFRGEPLLHDLGNGLTIEFVFMSKCLASQRLTDVQGGAR